MYAILEVRLSGYDTKYEKTMAGCFCSIKIASKYVYLYDMYVYIYERNSLV